METRISMVDDEWPSEVSSLTFLIILAKKNVNGIGQNFTFFCNKSIIGSLSFENRNHSLKSILQAYLFCQISFD